MKINREVAAPRRSYSCIFNFYFQLPKARFDPWYAYFLI
jgi:hypothetical protein